MHRQFLRLLSLCLVILIAVPALGQYTRDNAANKKIDEAINTHYLATDFDKAEAVLTGTIKACEDKCSPATLAKAWMYVGIVRGSGRNDQAGAKEAFTTAIATDPTVKLDSGLATPETQASFAASSGGGAAAAEAPAPKSGGKAAAAAAPAEGAEGNGVTCTPAVTEVETRRHIPVQCQIDEEVTSVELRYKSFGAETWKTMKMEHKGQSFRAQIPCDATQTAGTLKLYVQAKNATGAPVANWGSKNEPIEISLVEQSTMEAPSYDDADAPPRCAAKEICPPDFPGCDSGNKGGGTKDWGVQCDNSAECKSGLLCMDGTCETAPSCSTNSDCSIGTCQNGKCAIDSDGGGAAGPGKKWWVGAHFAVDFAMLGGEGICLDNVENWACYVSNSTTAPYDTGHFETTAVGNVGSGFVMGTKRVMLSLDRVITPNITGGARIGFAFGGGPPAGKQVTWANTDANEPNGETAAGKAFFPVHGEVRAAYWFGKNVFGKKGIRPYVHVGGGVAQVDAKVVVKTFENRMCSGGVDCTGEYTADAWRKLGTGFVTVGGGAVYAFTPNLGFQLNLNAMIMLGASGFVLQPSGGLVFGL
ncbi:MAG: hypothetical protein ACOY0T_03240 [Myxococcota bacterium]